MTEYAKAWAKYKDSSDYRSSMTELFNKGILNPYSENILRRAFDNGYNSIKSQSLPSEGEWISVEENANNLKEGRLLVFSPAYPENDPFRYRIIDSQFLKISKDVTYYKYLKPPIK